ncbi:unnamed protein product [Cuscuta epithymum]|uniref:Protein LURP-one-related 4-like n=1 Tax=Cuscuta epithymum TaxID=186058 RepID=A0AAV0G9A0_9ASTE|nr:unnamed protein product [Cuscuta epithymum]CAH9144333.1 unnamed protein product [Cuscuta epithymum]
MARIYPQTSSSSSSPSSSSYITSKRETFTVWMKSLVFHGNGCTVFDSNGEIVYRIDNYNRKCSREVHLMDLHGRVLFSIRRKKFSVFGQWNGYRCNNSEVDCEEVLCFQVRRSWNVLGGDSNSYYVNPASDQPQENCYEIIALPGKSSFKIVNRTRVIAEVKQKQEKSGVAFGNDVLTLMVEPHCDHSLVMALVTVYGLINKKL